MIRNTERRSRKFRRCDRCKVAIQIGDRYLECVASPDHDDLGNTDWWRLAECESCAITFGRLKELETA